MSLADLHAELGLDSNFRPDDAAKFWDELLFTARNYKKKLGDGSQIPDPQNYLADLREENARGEFVRFSPVLDVKALDEQYFHALRLDIDPTLTLQFKHFFFLLVKIPITLSRKHGWAYKELRCTVEFNPGAKPRNRPIAYQIVPAEEWVPLIALGVELQIGLDGAAEFKVDLNQLPSLEGLDLPARTAAQIKGTAKGGLGLAFSHYLMQPKIIAKGKGDVKVHWQLIGKQQVTYSEPSLGVVLKVPREVARVDIIGALTVFPSFHLLGEGFWHIVESLGTAARRFFKKGAPPTKAVEVVWEDITARA